MEIRSAEHIHAHLVAKGSSCRAWALDRGYNPRTVQAYVQKYAPDTGRSPQRDGTLAKKIMRELYEFIDYQPELAVEEDHD
jgi:transposase